jgi:hypothetical protein
MKTSNRPAPLKDYSVNLWPLEGCEMNLKARDPAHARQLAARSWGDDITAVFAEPDYFEITEVLTLPVPRPQ